MEHASHALIHWITLHPHLAGLAVFIISLSESLAVVGLFVPGVAMMFAVGALVANEVLEFWPTMIWAVLGAVAGDGASFWLGHRFKDRLRQVRPFSSHPQWLATGERFLRRHGGKSILFGRFVGPVRPIIPVVAGMVGMAPGRFFVANVLSALVWAPAYLAPGLGFGAVINITGRVAGRLALLLVLLLALLWLTGWLVRGGHTLLAARSTRFARRLQERGAHRRGPPLLGALLDAAQPESRWLLVAGALLMLAGAVSLELLGPAIPGHPPGPVDAAVFHLLQHLRSPWGDRLMVVLSAPGDGTLIGAVSAWTLAWLLWRRSWRAAAYWLSAIVFGLLLALLLKWVLQLPPGPEPSQGPGSGSPAGFSLFSFPSGHAVLGVTAYGFLAVMSARALPAPRRWIPYVAAAVVVMAVAFSRLYLGMHRLSDLVGGAALGVAWITLLGIGYRVHVADPGRWRDFGLGLAVVAPLALAWQLAGGFSADLHRYQPRAAPRTMDAAEWWEEGWRRLPAARIDLAGEEEQPLTVQWAGDLEALRLDLAGHGWRAPVSLSFSAALRWFEPGTGLDALPVLPQLHDGHHQSLLLVHPLPPEAGTEGAAGAGTGPRGGATQGSGARRLVLRIWTAGVVLGHGAPVWVGTVTRQRMSRPLGVLALPRRDPDYDAPLAYFTRYLDGLDWKRVQRPPAHRRRGSRWSGEVLLIRPPAPEAAPDAARAGSALPSSRRSVYHSVLRAPRRRTVV